MNGKSFHLMPPIVLVPIALEGQERTAMYALMPPWFRRDLDGDECGWEDD